jgi:RND family efflux transporter MFP subunit
MARVPGGRNRRVRPCAALACIALLSGVVGCRRQEAAPAAVAPLGADVSVAPVRAQPVQRSVEVVGTLYGDEETTLSAKVAGRVHAVLHDVGDAVPTGEVLADIETVDYDWAVAQKRAALAASLAQLGLEELPQEGLDLERVPAVTKARTAEANAQARFGRGDAMFQEQPPLITEQDHSDLRTAWESAKSDLDVAIADAKAQYAQALLRSAELAMSQQQLADTAVRVPAGRDGFRVAQRLVSVGEYVREGTPMFRLVDLDPIKFRADVPERYAQAVRAGQEVEVEVPSGVRVQGEIARISPQVDATKRAFQVEIQVPNQGGVLLPGGFARGRIRTHVDPAVRFVPQDAVVVALGQSKVFTVRDGKAVEHKITTGGQDGFLLEVVEGDLQVGDAVIVAGAARLADGDPVNVVPAEAEK